jgi:hypothetical protein
MATTKRRPAPRDPVSAVARARRHFDRFTGDGRVSMSVPEWGDDTGTPLVVYWQPFTLVEMFKAFGDEGGEDPRAFAKIVCRKAEGRDGKKLFSEFEDLDVLVGHADQTVVRRLADAMMRSPSFHEMAAMLEKDAWRLAMHRLADRLGKTIGEIEAMSVADFTETMAFHRIRAKEEKKK